jgi:membrane fusion protein, heavy metal efflux system
MRHYCYFFLITLLASLLATGCGSDENKPPAEKDQQPPAGGGLVRLSADTQNDIGLKVEQVARNPVAETIAATGWLMIKPGADVTIKASSAGFIAPISDQSGWDFGAAVKGGGQTLGLLRPLLSPVEQADLVSAKQEAEILIQQSKVTLQRAESQLELMKRSEGSVSGSRISELQEAADRARIAYEEAQKKLPFLPRQSDNQSVQMPPVPLQSPIDGRIVKVHVSPGQLVVQGDALWTVADWSALWTRVPVFEGDLPRVAVGENATIQLPGTRQVLQGKPVRAPQATEPGRRTVDVFYEIENPASSLRPGQPVLVSLPVGKTAERLVVPHTAIIWDGMGNAWVYVHTAPEEFRRRRVELGEIAGNRVVVQRGLDDDDKVVTVGTEALYGQEFKGEIQTVGGDTD